MDSGFGVEPCVVSLDVVSAEFRELLGERTPKLVIERGDPDTLRVVGFDTLDAEVLLKFAFRHKLYGAVQFGKNPHSDISTFDIIVSRAPITLEVPPPAPASTPEKPADPKTPAKTEMKRGKADPDDQRVDGVKDTLAEVPLEWIAQVTFPRVLHVQLLPKVAMDFASLEDLLLLDFVKGVRLGGVKGCVEVVIRRKPTKRAQRRSRGTPYVVKRKPETEFAPIATKKLAPSVSWK